MYTEMSRNGSLKKTMSSAMNKVKRGVAKTIRAISENEVFDDLPHCEEFLATDQFAIKILSPHENEDAMDIASDFIPVNFTVREKRGDKRLIFNGELIAGQGINVRTARGHSIMGLRLPENSRSHLGKILHPAGATIYKIEFDNSEELGNIWKITKNGETCINFINTPLKTIFGPIKRLMRCSNCLNSDHSLDFFNEKNENIGFVRPSMCTNSESIVLQFESASAHERAIVLGACLLFMIVSIYPKYGEMLQQSLC